MPTREGQPSPSCQSPHFFPASELLEQCPHSPPCPGRPVQRCNALKTGSSLSLTPSEHHRSSTPSLGVKPGPSFPSWPPLPSTYSPVQPREEGVGWEPRGSAASTGRDPSVLPGLAETKTRTHHGDGTGCWDRRAQKRGGRRRRKGRKRREQGRMTRTQGRGGETGK